MSVLDDLKEVFSGKKKSRQPDSEQVIENARQLMNVMKMPGWKIVVECADFRKRLEKLKVTEPDILAGRIDYDRYLFVTGQINGLEMLFADLANMIQAGIEAKKMEQEEEKTRQTMKNQGGEWWTIMQKE